MAILQEIVVAARNIRAEMKLDQKKKVAADFWTGGPMRRNLIRENMEPILRLASLSELRLSHDHLKPEGAAVRLAASFELSIPYGDAIDKPAEIARLRKEEARLEQGVASAQARLADESFLGKAPAKVVDALRATLAERQLELKKIRERLRQLES